MISREMREYDYFTFDSTNEYGQPVLSSQPVGKIKMAIYINSQSVQDNILYHDCSYVGLTQHNTGVNDAYVIDFNGERLKVLYVSSQGRYTRVFMQRMGN